MAYLEKIPDYKSNLINELVNSQNIIKYITGNSLGEYFNPDDLIGNNIFPNPYIPNAQSDAKTYICIDIYIPNVKDKYFNTIQIVVNVFSHNESTEYDGKSKVDLINIEIDKILNGNQNYGIDGVDLVSVMPYLPNDNFFGKQLIYNVQNLNQRRCKHNEHKL